ncbi:MAG TPA: type VI secretion system protein TssA [Pirellulales bacterium]|nr:type VI secretion system protein TssA [Pirellulales bacterium]
MPAILNFERILSPISEENPCGADLRWEAIFQRIKDARPKQDRDAFGLDESNAPDWSPVVDMAFEALASQSKDLMLAAWLTEALVHEHGFAGCRDGLKLINGLLSNFWEPLYPRPDGADLEPRVAPLVFLTASDRGARLPIALRETPLTPDRDEVYSWNYWRARQKFDGENNDAFALRANEVAEKTQKFDQAVAKMPLDFARSLYETIEEAQAELTLLNNNLNERFGDVAPGSHALRSALDDCGLRVRLILKDRGADDVQTAGESASAQENGHVSGGVAGPIQSREEAFRRLAEVASFLRQKEPQNPIYLLVERAVLWSRMPFEQLLGELVKDSSARGQIGELLGIKPPEDS